MKKPILLLLLFSSILMKAQTSLVSQEVNRCYKAGEYAMVIEIINKQNRDSVSAADWILMGMSFNYLKQYQNAEEVFQSLLQKDPSQINVYAYLANIRCNIDTAGVHASALPYYKTFLQEAGNDTSGRVGLIFDAYHYLTYYYICRKEPDYDSAHFFAGKMLRFSENQKENLKRVYSSFIVCYVMKDLLNKQKYYAAKFLALDSTNTTCKAILKTYYDKVNIPPYVSWKAKINQPRSFLLMKQAIQENMNVSNKKTDIPLILKDSLQFWNGNLSFLDWEELYLRSTSDRSNDWPRRLKFFLFNENNAFVVYRHGEPTKAHSEFIWTKLDKGRITDMWIGNTLDFIDTPSDLRQIIITTDPTLLVADDMFR